MQRQMTKAKLAIPKTAKQLRSEEAIRFQESTAKRHPDATSILARPRPVVKGKRHVPVFVNARGIPMLRIKKPQPRVLSGIIRSKLTRRERWVTRENELAVDVNFAKDEDNWDKLTGSQDTVPWSREVWEALQQTKRSIKDNDIKNSEMAKAMWNVVLRERELAAKEELEAKEQSAAKEETPEENLTAQKDLTTAEESQNVVMRQRELETEDDLITKEKSPTTEELVPAEKPLSRRELKAKENREAAEELWNVVLGQQELTTKEGKEALSREK